MFRSLPSFDPSLDALRALAQQMREAIQGAPAEGWQPGPEPQLDGDIPAGYTYLGQFIDHDITFDPVSSLQRHNDPDALHDFRTPRFDLDSLYGAGPNNDPFMYDPDVDEGRTRFLIGRNADDQDDDLPRNVLRPSPDDGNARGRALIGDPRNDENIIVGQLHLVFLKFRNRLLEVVRGEQPGLRGDLLFEEAQRLSRRHYQWVVVHDFLERIVGQEVVGDILLNEAYQAPGGGPFRVPRPKLLFYHWQRQPFMRSSSRWPPTDSGTA